MINFLCASDSENLDSEMRYNPICFSMKKSMHEHELINLNDSSTVSNETKITTAIPTFFFTSDKKSFTYHGQTFVLNCPMPKKQDDYVIKMIHWVENDTSTNIVNGKEYVSSENGVKIYVFELNRPQRKILSLTPKQWVIIGGSVVGAAILAGLPMLPNLIKQYTRNQGGVSSIIQGIENTRVIIQKRSETMQKRKENVLAKYQKVLSEIDSGNAPEPKNFMEKVIVDYINNDKHVGKKEKQIVKEIMEEIRVEKQKKKFFNKSKMKNDSEEFKEYITSQIKKGISVKNMDYTDVKGEYEFLQTVANNKAGDYKRLTDAEEEQAKIIYQEIKNAASSSSMDFHAATALEQLKEGISPEQVLRNVFGIVE